MNYLYTPWRENYIKTGQTEHPCPLCLEPSPEHDAEKYIIKRYKHVYVILNLYPYNPGHLMVVPADHCSHLHLLTEETRSELMEVVSNACVIIEQELSSDGINIGMNIGGYAAGGTIPEHLHIHLLPRFKGDTNFLPILAETKQISRDLNTLYQRLLKAFTASK